MGRWVIVWFLCYIGNCFTQERGQQIVTIAHTFLEVPYSATTLAVTPEQLVKRTDSLDCMTFVELSLAHWYAQPVRDDQVLFEKTLDTILLKMRYYDGILTDYASRKHYFLAFAMDNPLLEDVTPTIPNASTLKKKINYMSTHPQQYPLLADATLQSQVQQREAAINQKKWFFIPKEKLNNEQIQRHLKEGDIVGLTTNIEGLDVGHMGFLTQRAGEWHLLHASYTYKRVMVTEESLYEYLRNHKKFTGLIVLRLIP